MSDLDTSRAPRGVLAAQRLVEAVAERGDLAERHYLELKSTLDLSTKKDKEKIAKFILGASNRMPDTAATAFEGYAAMVIGVGAGQVVGIAPVEMMEIAKVVQQYVGAAGPRWDVVWVPIEGSANQVLIIVVDPPEPGQRPFPCRSNGESLTSGRIYIRADGETREANADEFDLLLARGAASQKVEVDFGVEVSGGVAHVAIDDARTLEAYVAGQRRRLLGALPAVEPLVNDTADTVDTGAVGAGSLAELAAGVQRIAAMSSVARSAALMVDASTVPEGRTEEAYRAAIDLWETRFRTAWGAASPRIAASSLQPVVVRIVNRTTTFFHDVEVKVHLDGDVFAYDYIDPQWAEDLSSLELPVPPRVWGPRQRDLGYSHLANAGYVPQSFSGTYIPPSVSFKNGGSVDLDLDVGELRPRGTYESEDDEFVLVVADASMTMIHGTWQLTARDHNEVFTGVIDIPVGEPVDLTDSARGVLRLDNTTGA
ncbi:hypothetical protein [Microbacterium sp. 1.5R]|uniref:hypothetical protein n=1 Tax=Microbacterium sp. 1.5R TaxID=1916917 RepID=UPI00119E669B|nr:hypothetical protein [Microbacterium sp. 1.5R]